jgi:hypothetical protein
MDSDFWKLPVGPRVWAIVAAVAGMLILGDLSRRMSDARRLEREADQATTQVAALEVENARLRTQVAAAAGDAVVEDWARREAKMILPGDQLVVPMAPPGVQAAAQPTPTDPPELPLPWEVWWALLVGE